MYVTSIRVYPIKSTAGLIQNDSLVDHVGLRHDRRWALFDQDNVVITARDHPELLRLTPEISVHGLGIKLDAKDMTFKIPFTNSKTQPIEVKVWGDETKGVEVSQAASEWFSEYLKRPCKLMYMDTHCNRSVDSKRGGIQGDVVSYADECPLLLISEGSLADLNSRLEIPVTMTNFRPNVVITGCDPFAEDEWTSIRIGECEFSVTQRCQRCVFTTIDPVTRERHPEQEPLRTLSTYRRDPKGGVAFGVHLIPRQLGSIKIGDSIDIRNH